MPDPPTTSAWADRLATFAWRLPARLSGQRRTFELVRSSGARVVYFNDQSAFWYGALGARLAGATVVLALRDTTGLDRSRWIAASLASDVVVSLSDDLQHRLAAAIDARDPRRRFRRPELVTIPSIVAPIGEGPGRDEARATLGVSRDRLLVGCVGAIVPRKRQRDVLLGLAPLLASIDAELVFVGDFEPSRDGYARACDEARTSSGADDRIRFVGYSAEVGLWYRALDLVVVGSDDEGLARCMIEALAHGVPVVSTAVCSAREVLESPSPEEGSGVVVPLGDFAGLADAVVRLARDPERRKEMGWRGRELVHARFDAATVGNAYDRLFERLSARTASVVRTSST